MRPATSQPGKDVLQYLEPKPKLQTTPEDHMLKLSIKVIAKASILPSQEVTSQSSNPRRPQPPQATLIGELEDLKDLKNHLNDLKEIRELLIEFPNILKAIRLSKKAKKNY
ncbi:hypothetical protein HNY73_012021 [Argiope bruennichi]|uniref:Uncharacterized protein n=1 Tax=Argiope bruennichi TaxID=94029 RepID=A0A8T0EV76_ARGBR|nr:hypothetical protein HNY73_012021 [Argiope bruennichi]